MMKESEINQVISYCQDQANLAVQAAQKAETLEELERALKKLEETMTNIVRQSDTIQNQILGSMD